MIPEGAVEAAARASAAAFGETPNKRDFEHARLVLEAAAPHMRREAQAVAWDEGIEAGVDVRSRKLAYARNPYRSTQ